MKINTVLWDKNHIIKKEKKKKKTTARNVNFVNNLLSLLIVNNNIYVYIFFLQSDNYITKEDLKKVNI